MRKIDKSNRLSTHYANWENDFEKQQKPHDKYDSKEKFYIDVVMDLFRCQKGLCAYTEVQLCSSDFWSDNNWYNGKYNSGKGNHYGQLDHFDPKLKSPKGWLWDNFFMVHSDTNRRKSNKEVDEILKPDRQDFDENELFEYSSNMHRFRANSKLDIPIQERINKMIDVLGINHPALVGQRKGRLDMYSKFGVIPDEFPTAYKFWKINE